MIMGTQELRGLDKASEFLFYEYFGSPQGKPAARFVYLKYLV